MKTSERIIRGAPASPGIAIGYALRAFDPLSLSPNFRIGSAQTGKEVVRFRASMEKSRKQLERVRAALRKTSRPESALLVEPHLLILQDRLFVDRIIEKIESESINAEWAIQQVSGELFEAYDRLQDEYLRERRGDLEDIVRRLRRNLRSKSIPVLPKLAYDAIIVGRTILPSTLFDLRSQRVVGLVTETGSALSHTAIMARSLELPAVMGAVDLAEVLSGHLLLVDGGNGTIIHHPDEQTLSEYRLRAGQRKKPRRSSSASVPCVTEDGVRIALGANINFSEEADAAADIGTESIGLYRTEFDFFRNGRPPDEDALIVDYSRVIKAAGSMPVTFRTIDVGIDSKTWDGVNSSLGVRGLRFCLENVDLFRTQLRAILRAARHGHARILLPFVSTIDDLSAAQEIIVAIRRDLAALKLPHGRNVPVGVMIETPAAALTCDLMAPSVDFFCIGTNDLIQYCFVIDRSDQSMAHLYNPFHPAILRCLHQVYTLTAPTGKPVTVCGEMAADPVSAAVLLGLGFTSLSVSLAAYPRMKHTIGSMSVRRLRKLSGEILRMQEPRAVEEKVRAMVASGVELGVHS